MREARLTTGNGAVRHLRNTGRDGRALWRLGWGAARLGGFWIGGVNISRWSYIREGGAEKKEKLLLLAPRSLPGTLVSVSCPAQHPYSFLPVSNYGWRNKGAFCVLSWVSCEREVSGGGCQELQSLEGSLRRFRPYMDTHLLLLSSNLHLCATVLSSLS